MKDVSLRKRTIAKAFTWRLLSIVMTTGLVWAVTGSLGLGAAVGGIDFVVKFFAFYYHDRLWHQIQWGKQCP